MSSAINPVVTSSQASLAGNQVNKTMDLPGTTTSYNESTHTPQSLGNMHTNTNAAHSHPNQHHFSLNASNTTGHYKNQNMGQIPASNHPVANASSTAAGQGCNPQKSSLNYTSNIEDNVSHRENLKFSLTSYPPASQTLPASVSSQSNANRSKTASDNSDQQQLDKPQPNGTTAVKSPQKNDNINSCTLTSSTEKSVQPAPVPQLSEVQEKTEEKSVSVPTPIPVQMPQPKCQESPTARVQPTIPPASSSKPSPSVNSNTQHAETSPGAISPAKSTLTNVDSDDKASSLADAIKEPELKKAKMDEKPPSPEQISPKEDLSPPKPIHVTAKPTETSAAKSPVRKTKLQTPKVDESSKTLKEPKISVQKSPPISKAKRQRIRTQPYQSPLPEVELISKLTALTPRTPRSNDEKLTVFYKNEFLAVRNAEGSFYLCQAVQNVYKSSSKIKIRWLSQDKSNKSGDIYIPDFYDLIDFDCILTNLSLNRIDKGTFKLPPSEKERTQSILNRSLAVEKGEVTSSSLTEEHPDGLDLSLYWDEEQLKRSPRKRKAGRKPSNVSNAEKEVSSKNAKAPKVSQFSTNTKTAAKNTAVRKTQETVKEATAQTKIKKSVPSSSKRALSRGKRKAESTSPNLDQKKAEVIAKIGRKTAIPAAQRNVKNAKSGTKAAVSSKKATQIKTTVKTAVKPSSKMARRSTRK